MLCCRVNGIASRIVRPIPAVAQQKEQHVDHDADPGDKAQGILTEAQRPRRDELAHLLQHADQPVAQHLQIIGDFNLFDRAFRPVGQHLLNVGHKRGRVVGAVLRALDKLGALRHQRAEDDDDRNDGKDDAEDHGGERRERPVSLQLPLEPDLHRLEDDGEDHGPEDRAVEGQEQPAKGDRDDPEKKQESPVFEGSVHRRAIAPADAPAVPGPHKA